MLSRGLIGLLGLAVVGVAPGPRDDTDYRVAHDPYGPGCPVSRSAEVMALMSGAPRPGASRAVRISNAYQVYAIQHLVACGERPIERRNHP